jgi:hypothetical protein
MTGSISLEKLLDSPSFKYPAACCRKENFGEFRFDTRQLAAGSFIEDLKNGRCASVLSAPSFLDSLDR